MLLKPFSIMRRNVLFVKSEKGASISGRMLTIVQTAKVNALVVDKYLEYALENINKFLLKISYPGQRNGSFK